ncbi:hypothetical protein Taro_005789 [Colocasia esculenta]|uniref:Uncharacterized protein n=1 Tax=Colocasia esculenta TaxID=4460 RepID=A0A843TVM6_COLES|nr:hypothetical protein [Colocasia esculenta]
MSYNDLIFEYLDKSKSSRVFLCYPCIKYNCTFLCTMKTWGFQGVFPFVLKEDLEGSRVLYSSSGCEEKTNCGWAKSILCCALCKKEFNIISACKSAMEMWEKLRITYEGTDKVKETRIDILVTQYERF